jgi:hypothetical protein
MPASSRSVRVWLLAAVALLLAFGGTACSTAADAGQTSGSHELIDDVAARLSTAESLTYTAVYVLTDATTATMTHSVNPARSAYRFPASMLVTENGQMTSCDRLSKGATCTVATPAGGTTALPGSLDDTIERGGLIRPERVITLLTEATLDANAIVSESDTTIAGTPATCISISGAATVHRFGMCVTTTGLLGSFDGDAAGTHIAVQLGSFELTVAPSSFTLPSGAKIVKASAKS